MYMHAKKVHQSVNGKLEETKKKNQGYRGMYSRVIRRFKGAMMCVCCIGRVNWAL